MGDRTLSMVAEQIPTKPMPGDDRAWDHDSWKVTLHYQGRRMATEYHTGSGHRVDGRAVTPTIGYVLASLYSDASTAEACPTVEDFMSDFGYDDRAKASTVLRAVKRQAEKLRQLFGGDYDLLLAPPSGGDWSEYEGGQLEMSEGS